MFFSKSVGPSPKRGTPKGILFLFSVIKPKMRQRLNILSTDLFRDQSWSPVHKSTSQPVRDECGESNEGKDRPVKEGNSHVFSWNRQRFSRNLGATSFHSFYRFFCLSLWQLSTFTELEVCHLACRCIIVGFGSIRDYFMPCWIYLVSTGLVTEDLGCDLHPA